MQFQTKKGLVDIPNEDVLAAAKEITGGDKHQQAAGELEAIAKELLGKIETANEAVDESAEDWPVLSPFEILRYRERIAQACTPRGGSIFDTGRDVTAELAPAMQAIAEKLAEQPKPKHVRLWPSR